MNGHELAGVVARDPLTLVFTLTKPAPDFLNILAMGFSSARPAEYAKYVPDSAQMRQHTISDGPYRITSYVPTRSFTFERNPAWRQSSDPVRHAYVDGMRVTEGLSAQSVQQQIEAGTADMEWDLFGPPPQDLPRLIAADDKRLIIGPSGPYDLALYYYLVQNQYAGPMRNKLVRAALATAVDKQAVVQIAGGPRHQHDLEPDGPAGQRRLRQGLQRLPGQHGHGQPGGVQGAAQAGRVPERRRRSSSSSPRTTRCPASRRRSSRA